MVMLDCWFQYENSKYSQIKETIIVISGCLFNSKILQELKILTKKTRRNARVFLLVPNNKGRSVFMVWSSCFCRPSLVSSVVALESVIHTIDPIYVGPFCVRGFLCFLRRTSY
jgi:hypothetical protein